MPPHRKLYMIHRIACQLSWFDLLVELGDSCGIHVYTISKWAKTSPPYKYKGSQTIGDIQPIKKINILFLSFPTPSFL